jgi:hypothetical protein
MRAEDRRHAAVEQSGKRHLLARRLGMEVHEHDLRRGARFLDERVHDLERADRRSHEECALEVEDRHRRPVSGVDHDQPATRRARGQVRRPDDALGRLEVGADLAAAPDVVAERDRVGTRREQPVGQARRDPGPVGDVLAVDDAEVDAVLLLQPG